MSTRPGWAYKGDKAARVAGLTIDQIGYAITLRRLLAQSLATTASRRALADTSAMGREWTRIANACRNEARRMVRADQRLADRARMEARV